MTMGLNLEEPCAVYANGRIFSSPKLSERACAWHGRFTAITSLKCCTRAGILGEGGAAYVRPIQMPS